MAAEPSPTETRQTERYRQRRRRGSRAAIGIGHVGLILGVVALVLGVVALGIALTHAGPAGGAGSRGAPGPGALVEKNFNGGTTLIGVHPCTYYLGSNLSLAVTGPGIFVVTAEVQIANDHTNGVTDAGYISLANTSAACNPLAAGNNYADVLFPSGLSSDAYVQSYTLIQTFQVGAAGTYTFGIIGEQTTGTDTVDFYYASVVALFYPA